MSIGYRCGRPAGTAGVPTARRSVTADARAGHTTLAGLTADQARARLQARPAPRRQAAHGRTVASILRANVLTRFNALLGALCVVMLVVGSGQDALFGLVIVANSAIGIVSELRAKRTLDRFRVLAAPTATVVRDGRACEVDVAAVVVGDLVEVATGDQVVADGPVVEASGLEVDESAVTGEGRPVTKHGGDRLLSGTAVVAGSGHMVAERTGADAYAGALEAEARQFTLVHSEVRSGIDRVLRWVTWAVVPAGALLFLRQVGTGAKVDAVSGAVAGVVAMVPEGLVLLASTAFALGVVRLARRRVLVQQLAAVEVLARVDVVCVDKTGTLTEDGLVVEAVEPLAPGEPVAEALGALAALETRPNATARAIADSTAAPSAWTATSIAPFSSARRWSGASFGPRGTWLLAAPATLLAGGRDRVLAARVDAHTRRGRRVVLLARAGQPLDGQPLDGHRLPSDARPVALVVLASRTRPEAAETVAYLRNEGVSIKVLSGDDPATVAAVAHQVGIDGAESGVDGGSLPSDRAGLADAVAGATVFGRVAPAQKRDIVEALQHAGHVVAMVGDGVNDVGALKAADVGLAMGSGTAASRAVAELVLLDDSFGGVPHAVTEGRRVMANVERVANLFVTKTVYALLLVVAVGMAGVPFPFLPRHLTLVAGLTIGVPGAVLALSRRAPRARPGFVPRVLRLAIPTGIVAATATFVAFAVARLAPGVSLDEARSIATLVLLVVGLGLLGRVVQPHTASRQGLPLVLAAAYLVVVIVPPLRRFFALDLPPAAVVAATAVPMAIALWALRFTVPSPEETSTVEHPPSVATTPSRAPAGAFTRRRLVSLGVSVVLVVAVFWFVLPQVADLSTVWAEIRAMTGLELTVLALAALANLGTYWLVTVVATPGLGWRQAMVLNESSTAVANTLPGGAAIAIGLTYAMLGSWGFSKSRSTVSVLVSGMWNNFVKLGMPVLALAMLSFQGGASGSRLLAGVAGVAAVAGAVAFFAALLRSESFAYRAGEWAARALAAPRRLLRRPPAEGWGGATVKFRGRVIGLVRRSWLRLTLSTLVGHLALYLVLLVTLRDIGVSNDQVGWVEVLAVFAFVRLLTAIPITPGGLGIVELGLIGGLTTAGGEHAQVVAAVLVFRALTYVLPIAFGIATYLYWRRNTSWLGSAPPLDPALVPAPAPGR